MHFKHHLLAVVFLFIIVGSAAAHDRADFLHDVADVWIWLGVRASAEGHADFRVVASAEDAAVLNQQGLEAVADGGDCGADARHAAARDDKVEFFRIIFDFIAQQGAAEFCQIVGGNIGSVCDVKSRRSGR